MLSLFIFLLVLGVLIIVHEFGHYYMARRVGIRVEKFSLGFGPILAKKKRGQTEYSISAIPLGGYVKLAGDTIEESKGASDEYLAKSPGARAKVIICGPLLNYALGFVFFWFIFLVGYPTLTSKVGSVIEGYGAQEAGLQAGDTIMSVDGKRVHNWDELQETIQAKQAPTTAELRIVRGSRELSIRTAIKAKDFADVLGQKRSVGLLGITPHEELITVKHSFVQSGILAAKKTLDLTVLTYKALWRMITGKMSVRESVTGPLGIFYITSEAAHMGFIAVVHLIAVLSVSLALFNVLPLPILDGGHLVLLGIEKVTGKRLSQRAEAYVSRVGMTIMIMLAVVVTYNDVVRFFGDKIAKLFK